MWLAKIMVKFTLIVMGGILFFLPTIVFAQVDDSKS
jgi:hypothetical protein